MDFNAIISNSEKVGSNRVRASRIIGISERLGMAMASGNLA